MTIWKTALAAGIFSLAGCAGAPAAHCPVVHTWTNVELQQILNAERSLPPDSILLNVLMDYSHMRDDARVCP